MSDLDDRAGVSTTIWQCGCDDTVRVRDHPTRWSRVLRVLEDGDEVREVTRIHADFHYWIRVFVIDEGGDLQAGWICVDNYFDLYVSGSRRCATAVVCAFCE